MRDRRREEGREGGRGGREGRRWEDRGRRRMKADLKLCTPLRSFWRTSWVVVIRSMAPTKSEVLSSSCMVGWVCWTVAINCMWDPNTHMGVESI